MKIIRLPYILTIKNSRTMKKTIMLVLLLTSTMLARGQPDLQIVAKQPTLIRMNIKIDIDSNGYVKGRINEEIMDNNNLKDYLSLIDNRKCFNIGQPYIIYIKGKKVGELIPVITKGGIKYESYLGSFNFIYDFLEASNYLNLLLFR